MKPLRTPKVKGEAARVINARLRAEVLNRRASLLSKFRRLGIHEREDLEPLLDAIATQVRQASLKQRRWTELEENFSKHELRLRVAEVCPVGDKGGDEWQINKEIRRLKPKVPSGRKPRLARRVLEAVASSGYYGYLLLRKKLGVPLEHPVLRRWYAGFLPLIPSLVNPGGVVQLLEGTYNLTSPIYVKVSNVALCGVGFATRIVPSSDHSSIIVGEDTSVRYTIFRDFYLDHGTNNARTDGIKLDAETSGVEVEDTIIRNVYCYHASQGVYSSYATRIMCYSSIFEDMSYAGVHYHYEHHGAIIGNYFRKDTTCIMAARVIADNVLEHVSGGHKILGGNYGCVIANNHLYACSGYHCIQPHGSFAMGTGTTDIIVNNIIFDCDAVGIYTNYEGAMPKTVIANNRIEEAGYHGIQVDASNCVVENNVIINPSQYETGCCGIVLEGDATKNVVRNNFIYSDADQKPDYGIRERTKDTAAPDYNIYEGNYIEGVVVTAIELLGEHSLVRNNYGHTTTKTITADHSMTWADEVLLVDASGGAVTVTLPDPAAYPDVWITIKKIDSSSNAVTINPHGSETIDGAASQSLSTENAFLTLVSDGTNWYVVTG